MMRAVQDRMAMLLVILCMGMGAFVVRGAPVLGTDNFDDGLPGGWLSSGPAGVDTVPLAGGNPNGYYRLAFSPTELPTEQIEYIYNNDANHVGDYSGLNVSFSFYVAPVSAPAVSLNVYFQAASGTIWYNEFTVPANLWSSVAMDFSSAASGWTTLGATDFLTDITDITQIGIQVHHFNNNGSGFTYGLDNWTTYAPVPEPESFALALVVLASLLFTFRRSILGFIQSRGQDSEA